MVQWSFAEILDQGNCTVSVKSGFHSPAVLILIPKLGLSNPTDNGFNRNSSLLSVCCPKAGVKQEKISKAITVNPRIRNFFINQLLPMVKFQNQIGKINKLLQIGPFC